MLKATRPKEQQDVKNCINCTFLPYAQDNYAGYFVFSFILLCLSGWINFRNIFSHHGGLI
jgi:hypothetical protein